MTYRIPYYVGPLTNKSKNSWLVKKAGFEDFRITPWNFDDVVDKDMCEEEFINRMKKKCTYLRGEDVLPASSFLYSEFAFLYFKHNKKKTICQQKNLYSEKMGAPVVS